MSNSAIEILDKSPMSKGQYSSILICFYLLALDGFDVLAIAFAAPGLSVEWGISKSFLGWVVAMELIGMAIGSIFIGRLADSLGRRPIILYCTFVMALGMLAAAIAPNVYVLCLFRILTGIGVGAVLTSSNAYAAELSNAKNRSVFIVVMTLGYGVGAIVGGMIATELLKYFDWRSVFFLGAIATALAVPLVYLGLSESLSYLEMKQPSNALALINTALKKYKHKPLKTLPPRPKSHEYSGFSLLFSPALIRPTVLLSLAYLANISTFYFVLKWVPKLVVDMGFSQVQGGYMLVWANLGGVVGALVLSAMTRFIDLKWIVVSFLVGGTVAVSAFGHVSPSIVTLSLVAALASFFVQAATAGMYALIAISFPTEVRASGGGIVFGLGKGGAIAGPVIAGYLLQADIPLGQVTVLLSVGSLIAALCIFFLDTTPQK